MRAFLSSGLLLLMVACASTSGSEAELASSTSLADALRAELIEGGAVDLNTDLAAGRPIALVFWQAW